MKKNVVKLICSISLICSLNFPACANIKNEQLNPRLSSVEIEIYKAAQAHGISKSNISIDWIKTNSGDYKAKIKCSNAYKCKTKLLTIPFSKKELQTEKSANFFSNTSEPSPLLNKIQKYFSKTTGNSGPRFNGYTGNPGPKETE